jgi:hypothetical protein
MNPPSQDGRIKNYYEPPEKIRQKGIYQNDGSKAYMLSGGNNSPSAINLQNQ